MKPEPTHKQLWQHPANVERMHKALELILELDFKLNSRERYAEAAAAIASWGLYGERRKK